MTLPEKGNLRKMELLLEQINSRLANIEKWLEKLNGKVAEHEGTLREWTPAVEGLDDRFAMTERKLDEAQRELDSARGVRDAALIDLRDAKAAVALHQAELDSARGIRDAALRDLSDTRSTVAKHDVWIHQRDGAERESRLDWLRLIEIVGIAALLVKLFLFHN